LRGKKVAILYKHIGLRRWKRRVWRSESDQNIVADNEYDGDEDNNCLLSS